MTPSVAPNVSPLDLLLPQPLEVRSEGEALRLPRRPTVRLPSDNPALRQAARRILDALAAAGLEPRLATGADGGSAAEAEIEVRLGTSDSPSPQGYRIDVGSRGARIEGDDEPGVFYAALTLAQWLRLHSRRPGGEGLSLPPLAVVDRPDFLHRGVLLDVSRNRVPRLDSLFALVDRLAGWKINQLQLYTEHTFAYRDHEIVWRDASPLTATEVVELDRYCAERFVELVPNQNSFGHLHRWLAHPAYRPLAERPEGVRHPFGESVEPFSLCPTDPASLELIEALWDELLAQFSSRQANAGLDETLDLGTGRSRAECERRGTGRVYLDFLLGVRRILLERGRRLQFWGDMMLAHRELIAELPKDVVPLLWGYEAEHPFAEEIAPFAAAGLSFYVCPGTSSWNSLAGRADNALANLRAAASAGRAAGADGYLITDWGDHGHLQPPAASYLGLLAGAAHAWRSAAHGEAAGTDWAALLDRHAFDDTPLGRPALELARSYLDTGVELKNGSVLFRLLLHALEDLTAPRFEKLTAAGLDRARERIAAAASALATTESGGCQAGRELAWVGNLLDFACRLGLERLSAGRDVPLSSLPWGVRRRLRRGLAPLVAELRELWLESSRPGGLDDSTHLLSRIVAALR